MPHLRRFALPALFTLILILPLVLLLFPLLQGGPDGTNGLGARILIDAIDGDWCHADGRRLSISGPRIVPERARAVFYGSCSEADAAWATARLRPDPPIPLLQRFVERNSHTLPRGYIECTEDRAISIERQRFMAGRGSFGCSDTLHQWDARCPHPGEECGGSDQRV